MTLNVDIQSRSRIKKVKTDQGEEIDVEYSDDFCHAKV